MNLFHINSLVGASPIGELKEGSMLPFCTHSSDYYLRVLEQNKVKQHAKPKTRAMIEMALM